MAYMAALPQSGSSFSSSEAVVHLLGCYLSSVVVFHPGHDLVVIHITAVLVARLT